MDRIRVWSGRLRVAAQFLTLLLWLGGGLIFIGVILAIANYDPSTDPALTAIEKSTAEYESSRADAINVGVREEWVGPDLSPLERGMFTYVRAWRVVRMVSLGAAELTRVLIAILMLRAFAELMRLYERGTVFDAENVRQMRMIGVLCLIWAFVPTPDWDSLRMVIRIDLMLAYLASFVGLLSWVMDEARKDREELDAVV